VTFLTPVATALIAPAERRLAGNAQQSRVGDEAVLSVGDRSSGLFST
jgi:hypothetical protein